jgi:hypothetical protein
MSPIDQLIAKATAHAPPGAMVWMIGIQIPGQDLPFITLPNSVESTADGVSPAVESKGKLDGMTHEQRLQLIGNVQRSMSLKQWSDEIGNVWDQNVSERELKRAVRANVLQADGKGDGKDHKTLVIQPERIVGYLALCHAVQMNQQPQPAWWKTVRRGPNACIA